MTEDVVRQRDVIELRHLRYFVAAAEHGSFRKAGAALGLSQSAISRCIADLEGHIGASLFHRHTSGVTQTYAGQRFLIRAREVIRSVSEGAHDVAVVGRSEEGRIRIGIYSSIASGFLAELLGTYGRRHRKVEIEMVDGNPVEHVSATLTTGGGAHGVSASADGALVFVTNIADDTVSIIDVRRQEVVKTVLVGDRPNGIVHGSGSR